MSGELHPMDTAPTDGTPVRVHWSGIGEAVAQWWDGTVTVGGEVVKAAEAMFVSAEHGIDGRHLLGEALGWREAEAAHD